MPLWCTISRCRACLVLSVLALAFPGYLKKFTVSYYLQALVPHAMPNDNVISLIQGIFHENPSLPQALFFDRFGQIVDGVKLERL